MTESLREMQRAFAAGIFADDPAVHAHLGEGRFGAARHLQVYRNNTFANLTDALAAIYPVVQRLVGEGFFGYAADRYIRAHPPRSGNLHDFGESFAGFLSAFEPARELVYLPDVARLERAWHESFHAAHSAALAVERLARVPESERPALRFRLHPSVRLLASPFPILRIWEVNQDGCTGDQQVDLDSGGVRLLVHRPELRVEIEALAPGDYALLAALAAGTRLGAACEQALAADPDMDLGATLRHFVARRAIVDLVTYPAP
jgi:hypothetical protein